MVTTLARRLGLVVGLVLAVLVVPGSIAKLPLTAGTEVLPFGSTWHFYRGHDTPLPGWAAAGPEWATGPAPFGFGKDVGPVATWLPEVKGTQPLSTYLWTEFELNDLHQPLQVESWADDGVVLFINGSEFARFNVDPSTGLEGAGHAVTAPPSKAARRTISTVNLPPTAIRPGSNILAAQLVSNWHNTRNLSFDAAVITRKSVEDTSSPPLLPADSAVLPGWGAPVWRDEFHYVDPVTRRPAVDPAKWNVRDRSDLGLLFDAAVVREKQVSVDERGILHIKADWLAEPLLRPGNQPGPRQLWHETGYLDHRSLTYGDVEFAQPYGRWEVRARVPTGPHTLGALAAFWLRNEQSGEIDILEAWGYDEEPLRDQRIDSAATTVHTHTKSPDKNSKYVWHHADLGGPVPVWDSFHVYAFELTPNYAAVSVDGVELMRATPSTHPNLWDPEYFGSPLHVRLNLHVGPSDRYWGLPDPSRRSATRSLDFEVDYVRIWSADF